MKKVAIAMLLVTIIFTGVFISHTKKQNPIIIPPLVSDATISIPEEYKISLQVGEIDTRVEDPMIKYLGDREDAYILVQVKDRAQYEKVGSELSSIGATLYGYVPNYSFILKTPTSKLNEIATLEGVAWVGWYYPEYKTTLKDSDNIDSPLTIMMFPNEEEVVLAIAKLKEMGTAASEYYCTALACTYTNYKLDSNHAIEDITNLDVVLWVEQYSEPSINTTSF